MDRSIDKSTYRPSTTSAYSLVTDRWVTMVSPRGARPHAPGPNALFRMRRYLISGRYRMPSGFTSTSSTLSGWRRVSVASFGNGSAERPWKDRDQSTCRLPSSSITGWSANPPERTCAARVSGVARMVSWATVRDCFEVALVRALGES